MISRPIRLPADQKRITDLLLAYRIATTVYAYPTIWRMRLLLTSRVGEPEFDTRLWEGPAGQISGFAMLWRRKPESPYLVLERFVDPVTVSNDLVNAMLEWSTQRARTIATETKKPLFLYTCSLHPAIHSDSQLELFGFARIPPNPQEHNVYMRHTLQDIPVPEVPKGFSIRILNSPDDLKAYRALYGFSAVHSQHNQELLASDEYNHFVAVDSPGNFAAYCECSFFRAEWQRSGQHIGWIDYIQTRPENQRQGLGRALLLTGIQHLRAQDTETVVLVTVSSNLPALHLYKAVGFKPIESPETPGYQMNIPGK
jgi:mycothiol synthase